MTKSEAHELLERQKRGFLCLPSEVNQALWITGDTRSNFVNSSNGMEEPIYGQDEGIRKTQSLYMVGRDSRRHGKEAWEAICG